MASIGFTYWQDGDMWLGYFDRYPDYMAQGTLLEDRSSKGMADAEAGRVVDLDTTLNRPYSCAIAASKSGPSSTTRSLIRFYPRAKCQNE
jgi:hypothetical protein